MANQATGRTVLALFDAHRTIREFKPDPLPRADLDALMQAARRAPSGGSLQLGTLIRITDRDLRRRLARLAGDQEQIRDAPEFFVACLDAFRQRLLMERRGAEYAAAPVFTVFYGLLDTMLMVANLATAAEALGYGVCYIGAIQNHLDQVARLLKLPAGVLPVVGLCCGIPAEPLPPLRPRLPISVSFMENGYQRPSAEQLDHCFETMAATTRSGDWFKVLSRYWLAGAMAAQREPVLRRALAEQGLAW